MDLATQASSRYVDLALKIRRAKTGEILLAAGGRWDRLLERYTTERPERVKFVDIEESQVELITWLAEWLRKFREGVPRDDSLVVAGGDRRGGKTFALLLCLIATALDVPKIGKSSLVGWIVSVSYPERDEVDRFFQEIVPSEWYTARKAPEFRYLLVNKASIRNVSADKPDSLKRGRVDIVGYNEGQKMPVAALSNGIYGTVDKGGLAIVAANAPRKQRGEWVRELREAIEEKRIRGAKFFGFSAKDNRHVDADARGRVGEILRIIDPAGARADHDDLWLPVGDRAYPQWSRKLVERVPTVGVRDITAEVLKRLTFVAYDFLGGADFQGRPHQAGGVLRIIEGPDGPIIWLVEEMIVEGTELHLSDEAYSRGYTPETLLWVPDASGSFQDAQHSGQTTSYELLRSQRWNVQAPTEIKRPDRSKHPKNPDVDQRLGVMFRLMEQRRFRIDPSCKWAIESFRECPLGANRFGKRRPYGNHAHITDAVSYPCYFLETKLCDPVDFHPSDITIVRFKRPGSDFYG